MRDKSKYRDFINFSWMSGNWVMKGNDYTIYERWEGLSEVVMEGHSVTISDKGDTLGKEELRILKIDDVYYYLAKPNTKSKPTMFKMTTDSIRLVRFFDPTNDFPKWIIYQRKDDSLFAIIKNEEKSMTFKYKKD